MVHNLLESEGITINYNKTINTKNTNKYLKILDKETLTLSFKLNTFCKQLHQNKIYNLR